MNQLSTKIASSTKNATFNLAIIQEFLNLLAQKQPQYQNFDYIGDGSSSIILKATNNDNAQVALKVIVVEQNVEEIRRVKSEYDFLQQTCKCSYFITVNSCFFLIDNDREKYFVVDMELCKSSLGELLEEFRKANLKIEEEIKNILAIQMLDSLHMLHKKGILHRDIKLLNILISDNSSPQKDTPFIIKLGDLRLFSSHLKPYRSKSFLAGKTGSTNYVSVEASLGKQREQSDLFSLGIVFLQLDNYLTFDFSKVNNSEFSHLQREGIGALSSYELNRKSQLYKIASIFLNPDYLQRQSALEILDQFLQQQQYANTFVYSIITEASAVSDQMQLLIPNPLDKNKLQIEELSSVVEDLQKKRKISFCSEDEKQVVFFKRMENLMHKSQSVEKEIDNIEKNFFISSENIQLAIRSLYKQRQFSLFSLLGRRASQIVFAVRNLKHKRDSVIKLSLAKDKIEIRRQISIMQKVFSPYIVKFYDYGFFSDEKSNEYVWFEFEKCSCTLTCYLEQNIDSINTDSKLKEQLALQMMDAVNTLHYQGVLHGNIKLDNFLISKDHSGGAILKLTDFNESGLLGSSLYESELYSGYLIEGRTGISLKGKYGTLVFRSPERQFGNWISLTFKSDSFAVGLCLLLLDNYFSFNRLFVQNYLNLLYPYQTPFLSCQHLFNKNNSIYKWASSLLLFDFSSRPYLRKIIDQTNDSLVPLHSKINFQVPLNTINLRSPYLHFKNLKYKEINNFFNTDSDTFSNLLSLTIDLSSNNNLESKGRKSCSSCISNLISNFKKHFLRYNIEREVMNSFSSSISKIISLSSFTIDLSANNIGSEGMNSFSSCISKLLSLSSFTIDLSLNKIGNKGMIQFSSGISKLHLLSSFAINLSGSNIESEGMSAFSSNISNLISLTSLTINLSKSNIESEIILILSLGISQQIKLSSLTIDLSKNNIGSEGINQFSSCLSKLHSLSSFAIDLSRNNIGSEGMNSFWSGISKLLSLSSLTIDLSWNEIGNKGMNLYSSFISKLDSLSSFTIDLSRNNIGSEGMNSFSSEISKLISLSTFKIDLSWNKIGNKGMNLFSSTISKLISLSSLTINLSSNNIEIQGMSEFLSCMSKLISLSFFAIDLSVNNIGSEEMNEFSSRMSKHISLSSLTINLSAINIGSVGMNTILSSISKLISLSCFTIDLSWNKIGNKGLNQFSSTISKLISLSSLTIILSGNNIRSEGLSEFSLGMSKFISFSSQPIDFSISKIGGEEVNSFSSNKPKLISLSSFAIDLSWNKIENKGMNSFSSNISKLLSLSYLTINLSANNIGSEGMNSFSLGISKLISLSSLTINLSANNIGSEGMNSFSSSISNLTSLSSLTINLSANKIESEGMNSFSLGISKLISLSSFTINLSLNKIGNKGMSEFSTGISKLISLTSLTIDLSSNNIKLNKQIQLRNLIHSKLFRIANKNINLYF